MKYLTLIAILGCDDPDVDYDLSCDHVSCPNADDTSSFQSGDGSNFTCTWNCAEYEGDTDRYVSLSFWSWGGQCWELDTEYVSEGACD